MTITFVFLVWLLVFGPSTLICFLQAGDILKLVQTLRPLTSLLTINHRPPNWSACPQCTHRDLPKVECLSKMDLLPTLVSQPQARLALASSLLPAPPHHLPQPGLAAKPPSPMMPAPRLQVGGVSREFKSTISPEDIAYLRQKHEADMTPLERQLLEVYDAQSMTSAGKASRAGAAQSIVSTTSQAVALLRRTGLVSPLTSRQGTVSTSGASLEQEHQAPDTQQQVKHRWTGAYPSTTGRLCPCPVCPDRGD